MKKRELGINFYNLTRRIHGPANIKNPIGADLATLLKSIASAINSKAGMRREINKGSVLLELTEIQYDKTLDEFRLLLNYSDSDLADFNFKNVKTKKSRPSNKEKDDGIDKSTHVLIKVKSPDHALMIATKGGGIGVTRLKKFFDIYAKALSGIPQHASLFEQPHPNGVKDQTYKVRYAFDCAGHQDETLREALSSGRLRGVQLFKYEKDAPLDAAGALKKKATILRLAPDTGVFSLGRLQVALQDAPQGYSEAVVAFTDKEGKKRQKRFEISNLEQAFVRTDTIKFDTDLVQSYSSIFTPIISRMREHL